MQDSPSSTIRIRPHHLLCMLTFVGKGYSPEFVANFERIARLIASRDQTIEIVFAPDDICAPLMSDQSCHCRNASVLERDRLAAVALTDLLQRSVLQGAKFQLNSETLDRMRAAFQAGTIRKACRGCQWSEFCDDIAKENFSQTRLLCDNSSVL
jgi:uncharacterized protein